MELLSISFPENQLKKRQKMRINHPAGGSKKEHTIFFRCVYVVYGLVPTCGSKIYIVSIYRQINHMIFGHIVYTS